MTVEAGEPPTPKILEGRNHVCRVFRNWDTRRRRQAIVIVSYSDQGYPIALVHERTVSDHIDDLRVEDTSKAIAVVMEGGRHSSSERASMSFNALNVQAWVLRRDGSSLRSLATPSIGVGEAAPFETMRFRFEHAQPDELDAVVLRVDGKLTVHKIHPKRPN